MHAELLNLNHWDGWVTIQNAEAIRNQIVARLGGKPVIIVIDNPALINLEIIYRHKLLTAVCHIDTTNNSIEIDLKFIRVDLSEYDLESNSSFHRIAFKTDSDIQVSKYAHFEDWFIIFEGNQIVLRRRHKDDSHDFRIVMMAME